MTESETELTGTAPARRKMSAAVLVVLAITVVGIGIWLAWRPQAAQVQGIVDAREYRVASKVTGRLAEVLVGEGEKVAAGQLLARIDSPEVLARQTQADAAIEAAQSQADKAETGARPTDIAAAQAQWRRAAAASDLARVTFERINRLANEGVVAGQKRDEARTNMVAAREAERAARSQYDAALSGVRVEDRRAAAAQAAQARGAAAEVAAARSETQIIAPASGEVGRRLAQPGEIVSAGYPVLLLTEAQAPWVTVTLREDELQGVRVGSQFAGSVPALSQQGIAFKVSFIAPAGDYATWRATRQSEGFDVKGFEVRLVPIKPVAGLRPGMSVLFDWPQ